MVLSAEGEVFTFGGGSFGQLGLGNISTMPVDADNCPFMPVPKLIDNLRNTIIFQISCGDSHSMALSEEGEVYG